MRGMNYYESGTNSGVFMEMVVLIRGRSIARYI